MQLAGERSLSWLDLTRKLELTVRLLSSVAFELDLTEKADLTWSEIKRLRRQLCHGGVTYFWLDVSTCARWVASSRLAAPPPTLTGSS
jgi:hypothetical protein